MKTIMQITPVQLAPQSPATDQTPINETSSQFTPHLEKAVTAATQITSDSSSEAPPPTDSKIPIDTSAPETTEFLFEPVLSEDTDQGKATDQIIKNLLDPLELVSNEEELPLSSANQDTPTRSQKQPIVVHPPAQTLIFHPPEKSVSPEVGEKRPETQFTGPKITIQIPGQNGNIQAPGKHVSQEITGKEYPSLTAEKQLPVAPQGKNETAFNSQEIKIQSPGHNLDTPAPGPGHNPNIQATGINIAKEVTWQKITVQSADQNVNLQVTGKPAAMDVTSQNSPSLATANESSLFPGLKNRSAPFSQVIVPPLTNQKTDFSHVSESLKRPLDQPLKLDFSGVQSQNASIPVPGIGQNQTLLQQLQQIIDSGNETGTVTIEATTSSYSFQYRGAAGAKLGDIASSHVLEPGGTGEKPGPKIPALRQDMLGQYFDAKLSTKEQNDSAPNTQTNDQQNNTNSQQTSGSQQPNSSVLPEQANSFQNISTLIQDIQVNQTQSSLKQVTLPSGTVVDEDNVIQQVAERFQINNRANDIKLNLKLHPEELGELKIDLTFKEGSIKGNVVVQSQQIQEIIEKNMLKLRSILEDQGFTVEEIVVTSESESVTDFELFEQHLSQQSDLAPSFTDPQQENDFEVVLEDAVVQSVESPTGVNIKA